MLCFALLLLSCGQPKSLEQVKSKYAELDSVRIHYKVSGHGDPSLVFVHGFGCDLNSWREQFSHFAGKNKMVFIDLPGYGESDKPEAEYSLDLFADAVKAVLDKEKVRGVVLVGHSLGVPVCRQVAFRYPDLASKLVDVDGVYCFYPADSATVAAYHEFAASFDCDSVGRVISSFVESLSAPQTPSFVNEYAASVMPLTPRYVAASTMRNLIDEKYWLSGPLNIPVLALASVNSQIPPDYCEILEGLYPDLSYHELSDVGHFIMMEQCDAFNEILEEFSNNQ